MPDSYLVTTTFADMTTGVAYNPATYPNHGAGLFFVGVEGSGQIYAYALDLTGTGFTRVATFASGHPGLMELQFDRETSQLLAVCDNSCNGRHNVLELGSPVTLPAVAARHDRPTGMANLNNEGFAIAPLSQCVDGFRPVNWADDGETGGIAIRRGTLACPGGPDPVVPELPIVPLGLVGMPLIALVTTAINRRQRQVA